MFGALFAHGSLAYALVGLGFAALATGLLALAVSRSAPGLWVGLVSLVLTLACSSTALVGTIAGRAKVDRQAAELSVTEAQRARDEGYRLTRDIAEAGFGFGLSSLLLGGAGTAIALLRRRRKDPEALGLGLPLGAMVLGGVCAFSVIATATPLWIGTPGKNLAADDPARRFAIAEEHLAEGRIGPACTEIDEAFRGGAKPERAQVRSVDALVSECFEQKIDQALNATSLEDRNRELEWLAASALPFSEAQRARLERERSLSRELGQPK
jgi:hypothetical protein